MVLPMLITSLSNFAMSAAFTLVRRQIVVITMSFVAMGGQTYFTSRLQRKCTGLLHSPDSKRRRGYSGLNVSLPLQRMALQNIRCLTKCRPQRVRESGTWGYAHLQRLVNSTRVLILDCKSITISTTDALLRSKQSATKWMRCCAKSTNRATDLFRNTRFTHYERRGCWRT